MIHYGHGTTGYTLTIFSLISSLLTGIVSLGVILIIIYHLYHHHRHLKREEKISLILLSHIYLFVLIFIVVLISMNIQTVIGDVYGNNFDSSWCVFQGYWMLVNGSVMYCGFVIQVCLSESRD